MTPATPEIPSCDPARHVFRKMNVIRWNSRRTPCRRNIPSGTDLGILTRARTRIPLRNAQWLIKEAKSRQPDKSQWVHRVPRSYLDSLVDLTVELFIQQKPGMSVDDIKSTFKAYLENRHTTELGTSCDSGFFLFYIGSGSAAGKSLIERNFELARFGVDLDRLFQRANVTPSATRTCSGRPDELPARFFLLAYVTLPDAIDAKLRDPLPRPKPATPSVRTRTIQVLEDLRKLPKSARRDHTICLVEKLRKRDTDSRYVIEQWANAYANMASGGAPPPWHKTEDARAEFRTLVRLIKSRNGFRDRILGLNDDVFAGLMRVNREYQLTGSAAPSNTARRMRDWIFDQQHNPKSIYSCYND
ncbi:hypothetical protein [Palleronia pelagia]|nr:hypothetical protein [Palleronia pelagia]